MHLSFDVAVFSPDGRMLAVVGPVPAPPDPEEERDRNPFGGRKEEDQRCRLWDVASGRLRREFTAGHDSLRGGGIAFSPDGRLLALRDCRGTVRLWETATGQEVRRWETKGVAALAFSPDGRTLAASDWPGGPIVPIGDGSGFGPSVSLWDVDAGQKLCWLIGHSPCTLAFSPDGRRLASGCAMDGTALVWDVTAVVRRERPAALRLAPAELAHLWADLGGTDAPKAYEAAARLARAPGDAVAFLEARRAERVGKADAARLARLIADLDDDVFETREKARKELIEVSDMAAPALWARLNDEGLSAEARQDIQLVLAAMEAGNAPTLLGWLRATGVLERVGTPDARGLLEEQAQLSGPAADEAKAALQRLDRQVLAAPRPVNADELAGGS